MTEIMNDTGIGQVQIADEVIAVIAGTATLEIDGVVGLAGNLSDFGEILGKKNFAKGIKIEVVESEVSIEVSILVKFGYKIHEVALEVQKRIKMALETMTGLEVSDVDITVVGVHMDKEKSRDHKDAEFKEI